jgi:hypothetical protein
VVLEPLLAHHGNEAGVHRRHGSGIVGDG